MDTISYTRDHVVVFPKRLDQPLCDTNNLGSYCIEMVANRSNNPPNRVQQPMQQPMNPSWEILGRELVGLPGSDWLFLHSEFADLEVLPNPTAGAFCLVRRQNLPAHQAQVSSLHIQRSINPPCSVPHPVFPSFPPGRGDTN